MKTYAEWKGSLNDYLILGDLVDEEMADYFRDVLPPERCTSWLIQMGEPYGHRDGKVTYYTLEKTVEGWVYRGHCFAGEVTHQI